MAKHKKADLRSRELDETLRVSAEISDAQTDLDAERRGQGHRTDSSEGGVNTPEQELDIDLAVFEQESESRIKEIQDHLAFVEEVLSPSKGSDVAQAIAKFHSAQNALRAEDLEEAILLYDEAIADGHPNPAQCHNGAALCLSLLEQHDGAKERFELAVSADPNDENIWHNNPSRESTPDRTTPDGVPSTASSLPGSAHAMMSPVAFVSAHGRDPSLVDSAPEPQPMFDASGIQPHSARGQAKITSLGEDKEDRLREIFNRTAKDGGGELSREELIRRLRKDEELVELLQLPQKVNDAAMSAFEAVFQNMDSDEDKGITEVEFVAYFSSCKSEFERAQTPDSWPSTAANDLLQIKTNVPEDGSPSSPLRSPEPEPQPKPKPKPKIVKPASPSTWKILQRAVKEPIYGEKIVIAGTVTLLATGVRGFPREALALNLMPVPDVPAGMFLPRRIDGQLTIKVEFQSIQDFAEKTKGCSSAKAHQPKVQNCSLRIKVAQAKGLVPVRAVAEMDDKADTPTAQVSLRVRDREGNVNCESKCFAYMPSLEPKWCDILTAPSSFDLHLLIDTCFVRCFARRDEEMILDVEDVHEDTMLELCVSDSRTGHLMGVVGIPVQMIHRNPKRRWIKLQDPDKGRVSFDAGVMDAGDMDLRQCQFGVIEMEHSLKWKTGQTLRQRIVEVMTDTVE